MSRFVIKFQSLLDNRICQLNSRSCSSALQLQLLWSADGIVLICFSGKAFLLKAIENSSFISSSILCRIALCYAAFQNSGFLNCQPVADFIVFPLNSGHNFLCMTIFLHTAFLRVCIYLTWGELWEKNPQLFNLFKRDFLPVTFCAFNQLKKPMVFLVLSCLCFPLVYPC